MHAYTDGIEHLGVFHSNFTISGNVTFRNSIDLYGGAVYLHMSTLNITSGSNVAFINNTALVQGGAVYMSSSTFYISPNAKLTLVNNSAQDKGGAIYIHPEVIMAMLYLHYNGEYTNLFCFFQFEEQNYLSENGCVDFEGNRAVKGGDDVYGAAANYCPHIKSFSSAISSVSSDPIQVCICDRNSDTLCSTTES